MKKLIVLVLLGLSACSDAPGAKNALLDAGYSDVNTKGWAMVGCGREDMAATAFTAKGATGRPVRGVVCRGLFKGSTIRLF